MQEVLEIVADLEGRQTRESVVQRALDEVGEETAGILQRAHETADEIAARSRAQAEGRIQRAEREADMLRQQADAYSEQVVVDTRILWEERQRLIQDIRQLADEVLATAEDASERVTLPQMLAERVRTTRTTEEDGPPTGEVDLDVLPGGAATTRTTTARAARLERHLAARAAAGRGALVRRLPRGPERLGEEAADRPGRLASGALADAERAVHARAAGASTGAASGRPARAGRCRRRR